MPSGIGQLLLKRDDLLPFPLAGNKYRKLLYELRHVDPARHTIVTVGSVDSNHCRTTAMLAAMMAVPTELVLHSSRVSTRPGSSASQSLLRLLGAAIHDTPREGIPAKVQAVTRSILEAGRQPYVIPGGCHTVDGVRAYVDAVTELASQVERAPDVIILPSGTGATQAGIAAGCAALNWSTRVIGISVARDSNRGRAAVAAALEWISSDAIVDFRDDYTAGGYGKTNSAIHATIASAWVKGLPVDPVYTGKALWALRDLVSQGEFGVQDTVVFWHTGGLFQALIEAQ